MLLKTCLFLSVLLSLVLSSPQRTKRQSETFKLGNNKASFQSQKTTNTRKNQNAEKDSASETENEGPSVRTHSNRDSQCERNRHGFKCVPYYLCNDGNVNTDGSGLIDIRNTNIGSDGLDVSCPLNLDICCHHSEIQDSHTTPAPVDDQGICGLRNDDGVHVRIVNGLDKTETQFGEFPWMVAVLRLEQLGSTGKTVKLYICGGSLIAPDLVLTAAHCVHKYHHIPNPNLVVRAGEWDTQQTYELYPHFDENVVNVIVHEDFNTGNLRNDVALLQLAKPFQLAPHIIPICLPYNLDDTTFYSRLQCYASGWGQDKFDGTFQNILKRVDLDITDFHSCESALRTTRLGEHFVLDPSFVCAGGLEGTDTCKGDGGSPLVCSVRPEGPYFQIGIVAWGIGCGEHGIPGVYADVYKQLDWITRTVNSPYLCKQRKKFNSHIRC